MYFQPRKWPDLTLKSPGIKPRRHNNSTGSNSGMSLPAGTLPFSQKSLHLNSSEGEQSPPPANQTPSAHEFTVFANVNIQGGSGSSSSHSSHHNFSQSQINLSSISTSVTDLSDTISLHSSIGSTAAPELPKRSNSIVSYTISDRQNPILSPRLSDSLISLRHAPVISPKILDSLNEEQNHGNENNCHTISPRNNLNRTNNSGNENCDFYGGFIKSPIDGGGGNSMTLPRNNNFRGSTYSTASTIIDSTENSFHDHPPNVFPPSPKLQNTTTGGTLNNLDQMHELDVPISPHVNVPNIHHHFNHIPPPLPPRVRRRDSTYDTTQTAQTRQAPDAPQVCNF